MLLSTPLIKNGSEVKDNTLLKYIRSYSDRAFHYIAEQFSSSDLKKEPVNPRRFFFYEWNERQGRFFLRSEEHTSELREEFKQWLIELGLNHE